MQVQTVAAPKLLSAVLKYEVDPQYTRGVRKLLAGSGSARAVALGTVLMVTLAGAVTVGNVTFAGTGNGTLTKANPAFGEGVKEGNYLVKLREKTADGGNFDVIRPDGTIEGQAKVGVAYDGAVKFTIADGATDFANDATFTIPVTIAEESEHVIPYDGTSDVAAVALKDTSAPDGIDVDILTLERGPAIVLDEELVWPEDFTDDDIAAGVEGLKKLGILVQSA